MSNERAYLRDNPKPIYKFAFKFNLRVKDVQELLDYYKALEDCKTERQLACCREMLCEYAKTIGLTIAFVNGQPVVMNDKYTEEFPS